MDKLPSIVRLALLWGAAAVLLRACTQSVPAPTDISVPTSTPTPTAFPTPTAAPLPTVTPTFTAAPAPTSAATPTPQGGRFAAISSGYLHTCALTQDGAPVCWGSDRYGQSSPPEGESLIDISSGGEHTCALTQDGTAVCWGNNEDGQSSPPRSLSDICCGLDARKRVRATVGRVRLRGNMWEV